MPSRDGIAPSPASEPAPEVTAGDVLDFIRRRFGPECDSRWTCGNCMWFATILKTRFPGVTVMYDQIQNHFLVGIGESLIDWTGIVPDGMYDVTAWDDLLESDPLLCQHVIRDCWM